ncbi:hypothetical protein VHUM_02378 [Vanrija humicola]|uniref:Fe2OG dioxygenase domain-containing protein n=1 Tax=Vanrija humicola TaxID=5417 RepID=A0A7D8V2A8_VANHU|nr:hypothetical protein VHUM_02378 [Vanrija humicola]
MLARTHELLDGFDVAGHPMTVFSTGSDEDKHVGDEYFLNSGDKIRYFLEPGSVARATPTQAAQLTVPPARSVNKIGHALGVLDPVFRKHTFSDKVRGVARAIGAHKDPRVLQSMVICKQPRIGGEVPCHNDSTFLYTDPPSAVGAWIALDECTPENGCLSFLPGSHKTARVSSRFVRAQGGGTEFVPVPGVTPNEEDWDALDGWRQAPCPPGTLVLIHGSVMHRSPPNPSDRTRMIYTFHMIEGADGSVYDEKNWLQPTQEMPFQRLYGDVAA